MTEQGSYYSMKNLSHTGLTKPLCRQRGWRRCANIYIDSFGSHLSHELSCSRQYTFAPTLSKVQMNKTPCKELTVLFKIPAYPSMLVLPRWPLEAHRPVTLTVLLFPWTFTNVNTAHRERVINGWAKMFTGQKLTLHLFFYLNYVFHRKSRFGTDTTSFLIKKKKVSCLCFLPPKMHQSLKLNHYSSEIRQFSLFTFEWQV